jgi:nickel transport system substrate-binding protein
MIYEGLVHYGENGVIEPALAESWDDQSTNATPSITFKLRR